MGTTKKDAVYLRGFGPGDQIAIYLDRSMVEETKGEFTVTLERLNVIIYTPGGTGFLDKSLYSFKSSLQLLIVSII